MLATTDILSQIEKEFKSGNLAHSYLLNGEKNTCREVVEDIMRMVQGSDKIDVIDNVFCLDDESKFGVGELRKVQNQMMISSNSEYKILYLENIERLSVPALNSILKILEEPPRNTLFFLTTSNINNVLDTIISRCRCYELKKEVSFTNDNVWRDLQGFRCEADIITFAEGLKTREEASEWVNNFMAFCRGKYRSDYSMEYSDLAILSQKALNDINSNLNFRLVMELLLLRVFSVVSRMNSKF